MKCPMLTMYAATSKRPEEYEDRDCLENDCAWWDKHSAKCTVLLVSQNLQLLLSAIVTGVTKMPHEGQFRK